jgi:phenylpropionate dioxygenase-like ring-hydroxylating dioxygenase large terminal subunit
MTDVDPTRDQAIEARLAAGLRNLWYPVAPSWMLRSAPVGLTRLGERVALWRDAEGAVHAIEDRCPHRGARLSQGWNIGARLACAYHGIEVDGQGVVARVPAVENSRLEGRKCNVAYPVVERAGAIFVWFGDGSRRDPDPLVLPEELNGGDWSEILCTAHWRCRYRNALDNVMDPMHGAYLHAISHSMAQGDKTAVMQTRDTPHGFIFEKTGQRGVNFDWTEFGASGAHWMRLSIPYSKAAGPGGAFTIVGMVTPVDAESCRVFFWRCRKVSGWERAAWRFLYRVRLEKLHWEVLEQDREILEGMVGNTGGREMLYAHDAGLVRLRQLMRREAAAQIDAERALDLEVPPERAPNTATSSGPGS